MPAHAAGHVIASSVFIYHNIAARATLAVVARVHPRVRLHCSVACREGVGWERATRAAFCAAVICAARYAPLPGRFLKLR